MNTRIAEKAEGSNPESFTGGNSYEPYGLTIFGGAGLWKRLIEKLGVRKELERHSNFSRPGTIYKGVDLLICALWAHICGYCRPYHAQMLSADKAFLALAKVKAFPSQSTLSRMLSGVKMAVGEGILAANKALLCKARKFSQLKTLTLDLDTHVTTCYGHQQRAAIGYNPKKHGRKSYNPMFCFIGETREAYAPGCGEARAAA